MSDASDGSGYFLYHSIGQYPGKSEGLQQAMSGFAKSWAANDDAQWGFALGQRARFIDLWRALIGAPPGTVTTCENVTAAVAALVTALPDGALRGRRVLVAADCFPSNHFLLAGLADRLGFTLDTVPMRQGSPWVEDEDMIARWGEDVGLALLTWVSSTTSHRIDLQGMVAHGRRMGSLIGVDITQAAGLLPFDVRAPAVDFTVSTSLKWMCGTPGAGILHVAEPLIDACRPDLRGWFSQPDPFSWDLDRFRLAPDIRRFDTGTPAVMAALASVPALEWHASQDRAAMIAHNRHLTGLILQAAQALKLPLATPIPERARGGSVMLHLPMEAPASQVLAEFRALGLWADARGQMLRLSPGTVSTQDGTERLITALTALPAV